MAIEIERKFLVADPRCLDGRRGERYRQGYLSVDPDRTVRVRQEGERAVLTIKGRSHGLSRAEFEYPIPFDEAGEILDTLCPPPLIEKERYQIEYAGRHWVVDRFLSANAGLILAEIELANEQDAVELPPWVGAEVSHDRRYFNANLARHPYASW